MPRKAQEYKVEPDAKVATAKEEAAQIAVPQQAEPVEAPKQERNAELVYEEYRSLADGTAHVRLAVGVLDTNPLTRGYARKVEGAASELERRQEELWKELQSFGPGPMVPRFGG